MVREAVKLLLDTPSLSNLEISRRLKVNEGTIRHWKKQPFWEVERRKLIAERAEAMGLTEKNQREQFKRELQQQRRDLKKLRDGIYTNAMRALNIANTSLRELLEMDDPVAACGIATKTGTHIQSNSGIKGALAILQINNHLYQIDILIEYFLKSEDEQG